MPPPGTQASEEEDPIDEEIDRNAQLALHPTQSQINRTTYVEEDKPRFEWLMVFVEVSASLGILAINAAALLLDSWGADGKVAAIAGVATWAYISAFTLARLVTSSSQRLTMPGLWTHTACLYGNWVFVVLLLRSYIIHPPSKQSQSLMIAYFVLNSLLLVIALGTRKGNRTIELEYEGEIPPAREPQASVFSLATFSWVDPIVWQGYNKTIELADVWNLAPSDKAAIVLANYRQVKKTNALAWHLLKHFKGPLIIQAAWGAVGGVLTFAPPLLLQKILEYVEDPSGTPASSAWFFVILLFVSGVLAALADGQALWTGRHLCIQLRAVIIGEIYAKALKRKAAANADEKVLGKEATAKPTGKRSLWQRLFGGKEDEDEPKTDKQQKAEDLKQAQEDAEQVSSGAIINLMAVDSFKVSEISAYLHFLWASAPVQLVVCLVLLYKTIGWSFVGGLVTMVGLFPINIFIATSFASYQKKILAATDARIHSTNEVLTNIRIIKYFAWEQRFMAEVDVKRKAELLALRNRFILWSFASTIWSGSSLVITFLSFALYTLVEGKSLKPSIAFTALSLFTILKIPLDYIADMIAHVQETKVSVDRVEEFLLEEETGKYKQLKHPEVRGGEPMIGFENGSFTWGSLASVEEEENSSFQLSDLNMKFEVGQLNVIAGPTGSGKTSLLMALLGEMTLLEGKVYLPGGRSREDLKKDPRTGLLECTAYCAQQAWLANASIKDNIVFASPWDGKRYKEVVAACSLEKDFEILDNGGETLVGDKGVTLSGGQKQRVSLARAIYCNARHVLLDDILSAVDSHTAKHIFDNALMGPLMNDRTCILVTHNVSLCLPEAQFAVLMDNGKVVAQGSVDDIIDSGKLGADLSKSVQPSRAPSRVPSTTALDLMASEAANELGPSVSAALDGNQATDKFDVPTSGPAKATASPSAQALSEGKAEGAVKFSIMLMYLRSMGGPLFYAGVALVFVAQQLTTVSTNIWIREWANAYATEDYRPPTLATNSSSLAYLPTTGSWSTCVTRGSCSYNMPVVQTPASDFVVASVQSVDAAYYLTVYAVLALICMIVTFWQSAVLFWGSLVASKLIHTRLIESISRAKLSFFDSTPLGQIMNRFSKDLENIDQEVAPVALGFLHCGASIITIIILISVITPGFLIAGLFISILYFLIGRFYIDSSRDLKRLESVQRSPLYQQFGETLSGMTTIRAYGDERRYIRENLDKVNTHNRPFIYLWAANRWLAFRVDVAGALVSFFSGVFVITSIGRIDAGAAGLALTYAVSFTENVLWFVRLYASNEQNMNSVERVKEYLDVPQEAAAIIPNSRPSHDWPSKGVVEFAGYSTRYKKELDLVLKDLTFKINPCEKIGVVGRTGAGKSSLALALFRALEAESGKIIIDGIDISTIGLQDLRENIVMVPQDPTLFSGTIRSNLDPFSLFTDEEIYTALRRVQLIGSSLNTSRPNTSAGAPTIALPVDTDDTDDRRNPAQNSNLDVVDVDNIEAGSGAETPATLAGHENKNIFLNLLSPISESGNNLSQGQRQLLCLARALLKAPKVLLMDEATASIDYATDSKIQDTIRELNDQTIITIAHRLATVIESDKVIVMERGEVVEMGSPWELLKPIDDDDDDAQSQPSDSDATQVESPSSKDKAKAPDTEGTPQEVAASETGAVAAKVEDVVDESDVKTEQKPVKQRWFKEMCETSGDFQTLLAEAKKSYEARRLVDVDA